MAYGVPTLKLKAGDQVKVDLRRNGKIRLGVVASDIPRTGVLCAGSVEWLIRLEGGAYNVQYVSEACIER